jgi:uncharacterized membrane protein
MAYIHKNCIMRWATIDGQIDYSRMVCPICTEPYNIQHFRLERLFTGNYLVDLLFANPTMASVAVHYLSLLYGISRGHPVEQRLHAAQVIIYLLYATLVILYVRIENVEMYADALIERRAYLYWLIQLYSSYSAYTGRFEVMSLTAVLAHTMMWREHVAALRSVNRRLLQNAN